MNFILLHYQKEKLTAFDHAITKHYHKQVDALSIHGKLLNLCIGRIKKLYPDAKIHLICNRKNLVDGVIEHYFEDLPLNHTAKFFIYDLIDEPAIYMDTDVLLVKPFSQQHLEDLSPVNPYREEDYFDFEGKKYVRYNLGLIYVQPGMGSDIAKLYNEKLSKTGFYDNDEYAVSIYIAENKFAVKCFEEVNAPRMHLKNDLKTYQSVHYSIPKHLYERELKGIEKTGIKFL